MEAAARRSIKQWDSPAALWAVSRCCMGAPGVHKRCSLFTRGFDAYHRVVAVEKVGVGGVVFLISPCLCVLVCERGSERTRDSQGFFCVKHGRQGKCFILWESSSACQAPVLEQRGDV